MKKKDKRKGIDKKLVNKTFLLILKQTIANKRKNVLEKILKYLKEKPENKEKENVSDNNTNK